MGEGGGGCRGPGGCLRGIYFFFFRGRNSHRDYDSIEPRLIGSSNRGSVAQKYIYKTKRHI